MKRVLYRKYLNFLSAFGDFLVQYTNITVKHHALRPHSCAQFSKERDEFFSIGTENYIKIGQIVFAFKQKNIFKGSKSGVKDYFLKMFLIKGFLGPIRGALQSLLHCGWKIIVQPEQLFFIPLEKSLNEQKVTFLKDGSILDKNNNIGTPWRSVKQEKSHIFKGSKMGSKKLKLSLIFS